MEITATCTHNSSFLFKSETTDQGATGIRLENILGGYTFIMSYKRVQTQSQFRPNKYGIEKVCTWEKKLIKLNWRLLHSLWEYKNEKLSKRQEIHDWQ